MSSVSTLVSGTNRKLGVSKVTQLRKLDKQLGSKPAVRDIDPATRAALRAQLAALLDEIGLPVAAA